MSDADRHGDANHRDSHPDPLRALAQKEIDPKKSDQDGRLSEAVVAGIKRLGPLVATQTPPPMATSNSPTLTVLR